MRVVPGRLGGIGAAARMLPDEVIAFLRNDVGEPGQRYSMLTSRAWSDMPCSQVLQPEFMP